MAKIKIDVQEGGKPSATITIPLWLARGATKLMTNAGAKNLKDKIDIEKIISAAEDPASHGVIFEVVDHDNNDGVTISIIHDGAEVPQLTKSPRRTGRAA